jgi:hypothetical protein
VQRPRHQLLARPALPQEEDGGVGGRRALEGHHRVLQGRVLADEARQADALLVFLLEQDVFGEEPAPLQGALEEQDEVLGVDGLGQEIGGALLHRAHGVVDGGERGHDDDGHVGIRVLGRLQDLEAAARGELQVGEDDQDPLRIAGAAGPRRHRPLPRR